MQHDQVGLIPGVYPMHSWSNIWKLINEFFHVIRQNKKNHMRISIGSEKAFEKIEIHL